MRVTAIVHHLMKGVGEIRVEEFFGNAAPFLGSVCSAVGDDLEESFVKFLGHSRGYAESRYVFRRDGIEGFSGHFRRHRNLKVAGGRWKSEA